ELPDRPAGNSSPTESGSSASDANARSCLGSSGDMELRGRGPCRGAPAISPGRLRYTRSHCLTAALAGYIIAWKLCTTMKAEDPVDGLPMAGAAARAPLHHRWRG